MEPGAGDDIDELCAEIDRDGGHDRIEHPEESIAQEETGRGGPGKSHAHTKIFPDPVDATAFTDKSDSHDPI